MSQIVLLNLGVGNCQHGFNAVTALLWDPGQTTPIKWTGSLPPIPELPALYREWRSQYDALQYQDRGTRRDKSAFTLEFEEDGLTHVSLAEFHDLCETIKARLNGWLDSPSFQKIERQLRTKLSPKKEIRIILETDDRDLRHLPWHFWHFLEDYPYAEISLSTAEYDRVQPKHRPNPQKVRILAILGNGEGIDIQRDRALLEQLPNAEIIFLVEPQRAELNRWLWDETGWDILFFAGHSSNQVGDIGEIEINPLETLTIAQLRHALKAAIAHGLQLAVFNSCDGLGLAKQLADLHLPQLMVMREPVPDRVAQVFLTDFLMAYGRGKSLYVATREARERLQGIEADFPCASWLPIICQNPSAIPPRWQDLTPGLSRREWGWSQLQPVLSWQFWLGVVLITSVLTGMRSLGALQALELKTLDYWLRSRPSEALDDRLLIVKVTGNDVQAQDPQQRRGSSLSNAVLEELLDKLAQHQPRVVALDIYRDFPVEAQYKSLGQRFQNDDRFLAVCKVADDRDNPGVAPPPELQNNIERVGFSDLILDRDGVVRRQLLGLAPPQNSLCASSVSLNLLTALRYLQPEGITSEVLANGDLQIGETRLKTLNLPSGGYRIGDKGGYQIPLNYRSHPQLAPQVTLQAVLNDEVPPQWIKDRIVMIGTTDRAFGDLHHTPLGREQPGVMVQAHGVSQIVSAVKDGRPLISWWPGWGETIAIAMGVSLGGAALLCDRKVALTILGSSSLPIWGGGTILFWQTGLWLPVVPILIAVGMGAGTCAIYRRYTFIPMEAEKGKVFAHPFFDAKHPTR